MESVHVSLEDIFLELTSDEQKGMTASLEEEVDQNEDHL
jgi:hypothetical protein